MAAEYMTKSCTSGRRLGCYTQHCYKTSVRTSASHRHGFCTDETPREHSERGSCRTPSHHLSQRHRSAPTAWHLSFSMCRTLLLLAAAMLLSHPCAATYDVNERIAAARAWLPDRLQMDKLVIDGHGMQQVRGRMSATPSRLRHPRPPCMHACMHAWLARKQACPPGASPQGSRATR
jgi:hypothetical protein